MQLTDIEVERLLSSISSGCKVEFITDQFITFKHPSTRIKLKADIIYDIEYQKAISEGLPTRAELEELIVKRNLFPIEDQKKLESLNSRLEAQQILLAKTTVVKANQDRIKKVIDGLKKEISVLSYKKNSKLSMCSEVRANEEKTLYLCWACIYNDEEKLFWTTYEEFKNTTNISIRETLISKFLDFYSGIDASKIRYIARHNLWRIRYVTSQKVTEFLFGVPVSDYSVDMLSLAYWSNYYDNIYQMMPEDRPGDLIIEDDDSLDAYMKAFYGERTKEAAARRSKSKSRGTLSAFDQEEVIVTASNELYRDIQYDKPREAQKLKERSDSRKRTKRD